MTYPLTLNRPIYFAPYKQHTCLCVGFKIVNFSIFNHFWINFVVGICLLITIDTDIMHRKMFHGFVKKVILVIFGPF